MNEITFDNLIIMANKNKPAKKAKAPKLTELHNEVSSVRERLAEAVKINDYLRKQIEIYHITHNNTESLLEMAQRLNLTKDELELYKEKLAKIEDLNESLLANTASNNTPRRSSNLDLVATTSNHLISLFSTSLFHFLYRYLTLSRLDQVTASPNSAVHAPSPSSFRAKSGFGFAPDPNTIALENEIRLWKSKHQNLKVFYLFRLLAILFEIDFLNTLNNNAILSFKSINRIFKLVY